MVERRARMRMGATATYRSSALVQRSRGPARERAIERTALLAAAVVYAAVLFNAVLALVNANMVALSSTAVIGCEAIVDAAALACCFTVKSPLRTSCVALMALLGVTAVIASVGNAHVDPKFFRDVMIIPIFAYLGLTTCREDIVRLVTPLHVIVLVFTIFEAVRPLDFGHYFNVTSYYINTRGFEESSFWSTENTDLFVSATRPGERFLFNSLNIHRLSSIFLEPVSLGNYVVIVTMVIATAWNTLRPGQKAFFIFSNFVILVGCDGRFATVTIAVIVLLRLLAPALPRYVNLLYLPLFLAGSAFAVAIFNFSPVGDDFKSRTAGSIHVLSEMDLASIFGFSASHAYQVMDSGIAYLLYSQSVIGAGAVWLFVAGGFPQRDPVPRMFAHMAAFYFASNLLVSYSVFSIKTASLIWFAYGAVARTNIARTESATVPSPPDRGAEAAG